MKNPTPRAEVCRLAAEWAMRVTQDIVVLGDSPDLWNYALKEDHEMGILEMRGRGHNHKLLHYECGTSETAEFTGFYLKQFGLWEAEGAAVGGTGIIAWRRVWG